MKSSPPKPAPSANKGTPLDWAVPLIAVALVFVMLVPLPTFALDLLLSASLTASVLVLLVAMYITRPVQFSVFPLSPPSFDFRSACRWGWRAVGAFCCTVMRAPPPPRHVIGAFGQYVVGGN